MKYNQLADGAVEKFEVAESVNFADLAKQAQIQAQFSQPQSEYHNYFNKLFFNGKDIILRRLDWRDLINGTYIKECLIGMFG